MGWSEKQSIMSSIYVENPTDPVVSDIANKMDKQSKSGARFLQTTNIYKGESLLILWAEKYHLFLIPDE